MAGQETCVGLGLEVVRRTEGCPGLFLASCEESVEDVAGYSAEEPTHLVTEKEHVLVAARLDVAGRPGVLLLDPGYHIARVVTVMQDLKYPHTGWFTQSEEGSVKKEYCYTLVGARGDYVLWEARETRGAKVTTTDNLVYVGRPFLSAVDVTERRNLVYNFRSWLVRDSKGQITAGLYFPVLYDQLGAFTLIYTDALAVKKRIKVDFAKCFTFKDLGEEERTALHQCELQMGLPKGRLQAVLKSLSSVLADSSFRIQLLNINEQINNMPS